MKITFLIVKILLINFLKIEKKTTSFEATIKRYEVIFNIYFIKKKNLFLFKVTKNVIDILFLKKKT